MNTQTTMYRGTVTDRLSGERWQTRIYTSWGKAQAAAEKLARKHTSGDRGNISTDPV